MDGIGSPTQPMGMEMEMGLTNFCLRQCSLLCYYFKYNKLIIYLCCLALDDDVDGILTV
jgi:hypothetical protein